MPSLLRRLVARLPATSSRIAVGDVALALVSYVPLLLTRPGHLGADTKAYLYLDPGKLLSKAPYLWDSSVGLGTVTHQNIGYLFPMGPYYWLMQTLGVPDWIAQRFWMGTLIFLAGLGVRYLLRTLSWDGAGITVAAFAYALSPYLLHYIYKHSVILAPFTALPWLIAFTARSMRQPGWRAPAWFALVALASGGINATSLLLVLIGPGLWVLHSLFVEREVTIRDAVGPILRIGALTAATSVWWIAGLLMQGQYGINVLKFTETYRTVAGASSGAEIGRSMGYWFLYGVDNFGPWFRVVEDYTRSLPVLAVSFVVPLLCVASALWVRFRYRVFFVGMAIVGLVVSVGAHPWDDPSPYGQLFKAFTTTDSGLAMRSTPRAIPLLALSLAVFGGAGIAAAARIWVKYRLPFAIAAVGLVSLNMYPLFTGQLIDPSFERPNDVPEYWQEVGRHLDDGDRNTRTLEIPGIDFANYRWGASVDPITPGLTDRDYAAHELVPYGSEESANLMNALDAPLQANTVDPSSYATLMRLMGVGNVTVRNDLEYERYRVARPRPMLRWLRLAAGLGDPTDFGPRTPNIARKEFPLLDEFELRIPNDDPHPSAVSVYPVRRPLGMIRTVGTAAPALVAGDANGLVGMAEAGILDPSRLIVYSGSVTDDPDELRRVLAARPELVITDSNTRSGRRWGNSKDNDGYTEPADSVPPDDPTDNRLDFFGGRGSDVQTVVEYRGPFSITASGYGNPLNFTPGDRAALAVDGDVTTEWKANAFGDVNGQWIELASTRPVTPRTLELTQATLGTNRHITKVRLEFDGGDPLDVALDERSRTTGQRVELGDRRFTRLRITVLDSNRGVVPTPHGLSGVGFAEIAVGDLGPTSEVIRPPVDLLDAVGKESADLPLRFVFRRDIAPPETGAPNEELEIRRDLSVPTARTFSVQGKIRLNPRASSVVTDRLLGIGDVQMTASSSLLGDLRSRASAAFDDNPDTAWQSRIFPEYPEKLEWLDLASETARTVTFSGIRLLTDGLHSVPTRVHFEVDGVSQPPIELDATSDGTRGTTSEIDFAPVTLTGSSIRLVIDEIREVTVSYANSATPVVMPIGISDVTGAAAPIAAPSTTPATLGTCRDDLLAIDGVAVPIVIDSAIADPDSVERGELVGFRQCGPEPVELSAGRHLLEAVDGRETGIDLDQILLSSDAPAAAATTSSRTVAPPLSIRRDDRVTYTVRPTRDASEPYWLILGQTFNRGWELTADGRDLGPPRLVNGFANAWLVDPDVVGARPSLRLRWAPQQTVWLSLGLSAAGFLVCLALAFTRPKPALRGVTNPAAPTFIPLFDAFGPRPRPMTIVLASAAAAIAGAVFVGWWWSVPCAVAMAGALLSSRGWVVLRFAALASLIGVAGSVVIAQWQHRYGLGGDWPQHFSNVSALQLFGYALLGIECVVEALRAGWRRSAELDAP